MIEIQGHRGSMGTHKENTLPAFQEGIEAGCAGLELDLRMSEGEVVIHHDPLIQNAPIGKNVPTLQQLFDFTKKLAHPNAKKVEFNLEMKSGSAEFAKKVVDLVEKNGFKERVAYSSFQENVLREIRKVDPKAKIGFLHDKSLEELARIGGSLKAAVLSPHHTLLTKREEVQRLQETGARVIPWTVDQVPRLQELIAMGVDGVITNYPRKFIECLRCEK